MANVNKPTGYGGSVGNWMREWLVDRPFLHNRGFDPATGTWNPTGVQQGVAQTVAGLIAPGADTVAGALINRYNRNNGPHNQFGSYFRDNGNARAVPGAFGGLDKNPMSQYGGFIPQAPSDINRIPMPSDPPIQSILPDIQPYVPTIAPPSGGGGGGYVGSVGPSTFQSIGRSSLSNNYNPFVSGIDPRIPRRKTAGA